MAKNQSGIRVQLEMDSKASKLKKFWFFVNPSLTSVSDMIQSVKDKLQFNSNISLFLEDALLPEYEDIQILRDGDLIRIRCEEENEESAFRNDRTNNEVQEPKKKKRRKENAEENNGEEISPGADSAVLEKKKKKKSSRVENAEEETEPFHPKEMSCKNGEEHAEVTEVQENVQSQTENESFALDDSNVSLNEETKKRRRRRRHHKKKVLELDPVQVPESPKIFPAVANQLPLANGKRNHIRFEEENINPPQTSSQSNNVGETAPVEISRVLVPTTVAPTNFGGSHFSKKSQSTQDTRSLFESLTSLRSAVFVRKPTSETKTFPVLNEKSCGKDDEPKLQVETEQAESVTEFSFQAEKYPALGSQPRQGDMIAFKILELGENYTPQISEYFQGKVISVSPFGDITMNLMKRPTENRNKNGKFELVWEEDAENPENDTETASSTVTYQWSELIEPRLLST